MRKQGYFIVVIVASLISAQEAHAQIAVIDSANLTQNLKTAAQAVIEVEQLKEQLAQLVQTYQMFTNPTDILNMATGMENQALENPMPLANSLSNLIGGTSAGSSTAQTYYDQNHVYTPTDGSVASSQLNNYAQTIANIEGMASTNLSAIEQRIQQLPDLESDLNAATSITQVDAINGRIASESQFVQAQQAQATNLQILASEQAEAQKQEQEEQFDKDQSNLATELQSAASSNGGS